MKLHLLVESAKLIKSFFLSFFDFGSSSSEKALINKAAIPAPIKTAGNIQLGK